MATEERGQQMSKGFKGRQAALKAWETRRKTKDMSFKNVVAALEAIHTGAFGRQYKDEWAAAVEKIAFKGLQNARAIAALMNAAPKLLTKCRQMLVALREYEQNGMLTGSGTYLKELRKVIKEARGE